MDEQAEIVCQMIARGGTRSAQVGISRCSLDGYFATQSTIFGF